MVVASFVGIVAGVSLLAGAIAAVVRIMTRSDVLSLTLGTLTLPVLHLALLAYWVATMNGDDGFPGLVVFGNLLGLAVITPVMLLASYFALKFLSRSASRSGG